MLQLIKSIGLPSTLTIYFLYLSNELYERVIGIYEHIKYK